MREFVPVIIESPYAGNIEENLRYLRACMRDSIMRGEAPFASHGLYTQPGVLNDAIQFERDLGISAGFSWRQLAKRTVAYVDLGWSEGMHRGIEHARNMDHEIVIRELQSATGPRPRVTNGKLIYVSKETQLDEFTISGWVRVFLRRASMPMTATQITRCIQRVEPSTQLSSVSSALKRMSDRGTLDRALNFGPRGGYGYTLKG